MINDASAHRHAWDQIPWLVNGTLPAEERHEVESHLAACTDCRTEFEFQRTLAGSLSAREATSDSDPQASWKALQARIEGPARPERIHPGQRRVRTALSGQWIPWLVAAMVIQAIGLGALGTMLWSKPGTAVVAGTPYRTLSSSESPVGNATIRAVFAPDMTIGKMQALLSAAGLQVQSGPSSAGVWSLEPAHDSDRSATQSAVQELRESPEVRFAEVIGGSP